MKDFMLEIEMLEVEKAEAVDNEDYPEVRHRFRVCTTWIEDYRF